MNVNKTDFWIMLLSTVRYSLGRSSYIVSECLELIEKYELEDSQKAQLYREIGEELDRAVRFGTFLGDETNHRIWEKIKMKLEPDIEEKEFWELIAKINWPVICLNEKGYKLGKRIIMAHCGTHAVSERYYKIYRKFYNKVYEMADKIISGYGDDSFGDLCAHVVASGKESFTYGFIEKLGQSGEFVESFAYCWPSQEDFEYLSPDGFMPRWQRLEELYRGHNHLPEEFGIVLSALNKFPSDIPGFLATRESVMVAARTIADDSKKSEASFVMGFDLRNPHLLNNFYADVEEFLG